MGRGFAAADLTEAATLDMSPFDYDYGVMKRKFWYDQFWSDWEADESNPPFEHMESMDWFNAGYDSSMTWDEQDEEF